MFANSVKFKGHRCFKSEFSGFEEIKPINVIIGRNNTGKSHLLDLVDAVCAKKYQVADWRFQFKGKLEEGELKKVFPPNQHHSQLNGDSWYEHGAYFVDQLATWVIDENRSIIDIGFTDGFNHHSRFGEGSTQARLDAIARLLADPTHKLNHTQFRRLLADRDIRPEPVADQLILASDGRGSTNIIRRYLTTANPKFPRELVQTDLLNALNQIFSPDGHFTEIQIKVHDEVSARGPNGHWEVFLGELRKGLIPLGNSGSGLKTILLVLLNLLVVPEMEGKAKSDYVFAFEELENNLHPALLRRLLQYVEDYAVRENATVFLTTHSSAALDLFGVSPNSQILHIVHDGEAARVERLDAHFDKLGVISELGAKPSDLLQANGIIWVEGPSDCIYINRWLDIFTGGELQEGRDYQCAFYGGSLLARTQFTSPEEAEQELVNLFRVNPNIVVVCDGDRSQAGARVKDRVRRIRAEVQKIPRAHIWVTQAREIENYVPGTVIAKVLEVVSLPDPGQFESFFPRKGSPKQSYLETKAKRKTLDKMDLAVLGAPHTTLEVMKTRFDWEQQMKKLVDTIRGWSR